MIKSMTAFAAAHREDDHAILSVTVRSVNHRFLDLQVRLPPYLAALEPRLRSLATQRVRRGRLEVAVAAQLKQPPVPEVEINEPLLAAVAAAIERARQGGLALGPLTPGDLLRLPQAVVLRERPIEADPQRLAHLEASVTRALGDALADLDAMRVREGSFLKTDLDERRAAVARLVDGIAAAAADGRDALQARLADRVGELLRTLDLEPGLVLQEIARFVGRSDISEELVRLRGHLAHWTVLDEDGEPCGRRLDFLLQEMNREINTIGSKAEGLGVPELIVAAKAELEKLREQVQNVE